MDELLVVRSLGRSGWFPGRFVEVDGDLAALRREGCEIFEELTDFFREFSGLTIHFERNGYPDELWFSGIRASEFMPMGWVEDYSRRLGMTLAPIGETHGGYLTVLIGEDGSFYGGFDDEFGSLGASVVEMMDNIMHTKGFIERF